VNEMGVISEQLNSVSSVCCWLAEYSYSVHKSWVCVHLFKTF